MAALAEAADDHLKCWLDLKGLLTKLRLAVVGWIEDPTSLLAWIVPPTLIRVRSELLHPLDSMMKVSWTNGLLGHPNRGPRRPCRRAMGAGHGLTGRVDIPIFARDKASRNRPRRGRFRL
jgi:hypothetical protein